MSDAPPDDDRAEAEPVASVGAAEPLVDLIAAAKRDLRELGQKISNDPEVRMMMAMALASEVKRRVVDEPARRRAADAKARVEELAKASKESEEKYKRQCSERDARWKAEREAEAEAEKARRVAAEEARERHLREEREREERFGAIDEPNFCVWRALPDASPRFGYFSCIDGIAWHPAMHERCRSGCVVGDAAIVARALDTNTKRTRPIERLLALRSILETGHCGHVLYPGEIWPCDCGRNHWRTGGRLICMVARKIAPEADAALRRADPPLRELLFPRLEKARQYKRGVHKGSPGLPILRDPDANAKAQITWAEMFWSRRLWNEAGRENMRTAWVDGEPLQVANDEPLPKGAKLRLHKKKSA